MDNKVARKLDLAGETCPMTYVRTKVALDDLKVGEILEVILDEGEPITNVPRSVKEDGHIVLKVIPVGLSFRVFIKKNKEE